MRRSAGRSGSASQSWQASTQPRGRLCVDRCRETWRGGHGAGGLPARPGGGHARARRRHATAMSCFALMDALRRKFRQCSDSPTALARAADGAMRYASKRAAEFGFSRNGSRWPRRRPRASLYGPNFPASLFGGADPQ